jgi:hypothetical protein
MIYMSLNETYTEDSDNSLSDVSALDDDFVRMQSESPNLQEEVIDDNVDLRYSSRKLTVPMLEEKERVTRIV